MKNYLKKFIGSRSFYSMVLMVAMPMLLQNWITNFVNLLDNIMVGRVGTEQMSGVSISNQLTFIHNLCIFGGLAGASIYSAQFFGRGDHDGVRNAFRMKLMVALIIEVVFITGFAVFGGKFISLYLNEGDTTGDTAATLMYGRKYLNIMLFGLLPFAVSQCYSSSLRETGQTMLPMKAGLVAVCVNLVGNWVLIYGKLGAPALGASGAAVATAFSRVVETAIVVIWTHRHSKQHPFIKNAYKHFRVPKKLVFMICKKGAPMLANETLWSTGLAIMNQCYSVRGLVAVAAMNINSTIYNLFNVAFLAFGSAIAIISGNLLGAEKFEEAKDTVRKITAFSFVLCIAVGGIMTLTSLFVPKLYNTTDEVRALARGLILVSAIWVPMHGISTACYFTLRSGGRTFITFLFDCGTIWVLSLPLAFCLSRYTDLPMLQMFSICQTVEIIKVILGLTLVVKGIWVRNIVKNLDG